MPLFDYEVRELSDQLVRWSIVDVQGEKRLRKAFRFRDFAHALRFTAQVGALAESEGHHPQIVTEWGRVTVFWSAHLLGGLRKNDFIMAAKTDHVYQTSVEAG